MARSQMFEWVKQGDFDRQVSFHRALPSGETITAASVQLHRRTSLDPETWEDVSGDVTESATVEQARSTEDNSLITGGENRAVRVVFSADPDAQPDPTDEPTPGSNYRVMVIVTRSGSSRKLARPVDLRILP